MANIAIKDLTNNTELDREAMTAIRGGARTRGYQPDLSPALFRSTRIVDYPPGMANKLSPSKTTPSK